MANDKAKTRILKNFLYEELACRCNKYCNQDLPDTTISIEARSKLQELRDTLGFPLIVNSNYRCLQHNRDQKSNDLSQHRIGCAFDIRTSKMSDQQKRDLIKQSRIIGFRGIGLYRNFIHVDTGINKPNLRKWLGKRMTEQHPLWAEVLKYYSIKE